MIVINKEARHKIINVVNIAPSMPKDQFLLRKLNARYIIVNSSSINPDDTSGRYSFKNVPTVTHPTSIARNNINKIIDLIRIAHLGTSTSSWDALINKNENTILLAR